MRRFPLAAILLVLTGCATAVIDVAYKPARAAEPLTSARLPRVFLAEVDDRTQGGFTYAGVGLTTRGRLSRPMTETLRDALREEFRRLGVPLASSRAEAEAVFKAAVTAAGMATQMSATAPMNASLSAAFQLRAVGGDLLWSNEITAQATKMVFGPGIPGKVPSEAMSAALGVLMDKLVRALDEERVLERAFGTPVARQAVRPRLAPEASSAPRSDLDDLPRAAAPRRAHAVVIGVERYRENLPPADFAAGDARLAAEYFKRALGVPEANLALLTDDRATKSDFEKHFERWLPNRVEEGDEVFVYFSGHGAPNPATGDAFLVPYDGDPTYIEQTGYPLKKMYDQLSRLRAKRVLVAMDSCFSGAGGRSVIAKGARPLVSVQESAVPAKVTVLAASAGDQISNSYQEKGHGLFTYYLLKGLKEKGADFKAVFDYLKPEVSRVARREYNADQDPQWREGR